jgi:hypothetical protein
VDAVIRSWTRMTRELPDGDSFGVDLGLRVVNEVAEGGLARLLPWDPITTHDIWASRELIDAIHGPPLSHTDCAHATDKPYSANRMIAGFTEERAKKIPCRGRCLSGP